MAKKKLKYYVVWQGLQPGIYRTWDECLQQVAQFPNAKYKSFRSKEEAERAFSLGSSYIFEQKMKGPRVPHIQNPSIITNSWCVDAACSGNPGLMEYRGVDLMTGNELFRKGPYAHGTNNVGEFIAIIHALAILQRKGDKEKTIYTDSRTAMSWVRKKKANSKLKRIAKNEQLFKVLDKASLWLSNNPIANKILKWETDNWGEIPADFGRK